LRTAQSGRGLLAAAAAVAVLLAGCGNSSPGTSGAHAPDRTEARFPGYRLAFSYPAAWKRRGWCWLSTSEFPLTLVTTASLPPCSEGSGNLSGSQTPLPPRMWLGPDGIAAWWTAFPRRGLDGAPTMHLAGESARLVVGPEPSRRAQSSQVNCDGSGPSQRRLTAEVDGPGSGVGRVQVGAVICGPNFTAGEAAVRKMLNSLCFTS
jgi:hypothetical protein